MADYRPETVAGCHVNRFQGFGEKPIKFNKWRYQLLGCLCKRLVLVTIIVAYQLGAIAQFLRQQLPILPIFPCSPSSIETIGQLAQPYTQ